MPDIFRRGEQMHFINWRISFRPHLCRGATDNRIETASGNDHRECGDHEPSTHDYATTLCEEGRDWLKNWLSSIATRRRRRIEPAQIDGREAMHVAGALIRANSRACAEQPRSLDRIDRAKAVGKSAPDAVRIGR